jgi:hypothetical protein
VRAGDDKDGFFKKVWVVAGSAEKSARDCQAQQGRKAKRLTGAKKNCQNPISTLTTGWRRRKTKCSLTNNSR